MDHAIYTAMGAASQTLNQQAVTASNLANASTPGFRAQLNALRAVPVEGLSLPTRTLVTASTPGADMTPGQMDYTSRPLDVALQQDGWLAVQTADEAPDSVDRTIMLNYNFHCVKPPKHTNKCLM